MPWSDDTKTSEVGFGQASTLYDPLPASDPVSSNGASGCDGHFAVVDVAKVALMSPSMPIKFSILFGGLATLLLAQRIRMAVARTIILAVFASSVHFTIKLDDDSKRQVTAEDVLGASPTKS